MKFDGAKARKCIESDDRFSSLNAFLMTFKERNEKLERDLKLSYTQLSRMINATGEEYNAEIIEAIAGTLGVSPFALCDVSEEASAFEEYEIIGKRQKKGRNLLELAKQAQGCQVYWETDMPTTELLDHAMFLINNLKMYFERKEKSEYLESDISQFELSSKLNISLVALAENQIYLHALNTEIFDAWTLNFYEEEKVDAAWKNLTRPSVYSDAKPEHPDGRDIDWDDIDIFFDWKKTLILNFSHFISDEYPILVNLNPGKLAGFASQKNQIKLKNNITRPRVLSDVTLNLIGLSQKDAQRELINCVIGALKNEVKSILVLIGKHKAGDDKNDWNHEDVRKWLKLPHVQKHISYFSYAYGDFDELGGLYVHLKDDEKDDAIAF